MPKPFSHLTGIGHPLPLLALGHRDERNRFLDAEDPRGPRPVAARVSLPRRAHRARARADGRHRADGQLLQAALGRRVPDGRHLRVHLDAGVHQLRRQQPDPDVPDTRARAVRVPRGLRRGEPVPRHGRVHRRGPRRHRPQARPGRAERRPEHVRVDPRRGEAREDRADPAEPGGSARRASRRTR